ncbi:MAG: EAL domain-containing protein [bacterium]|nr:EAL domain-containing protein [bacterium]
METGKIDINVQDKQSILLDYFQAVYEIITGVVDRSKIKKILRKILEEANTVMEAGYSAIFILDQKGEYEQFIYSKIDSEKADRMIANRGSPRGKGILGHILKENSPLRIDDISKHPVSAGFPAGHPPMKTLIATPLRQNNKAVGGLYFTEKTNGKSFTPGDEELIEFIAQTILLILNNEQLNSYIKVFASFHDDKSLTYLNPRLTSAFFDNAIEGIILTDSKRKIIHVNKAFLKITGYPEDEVLGKNPHLISTDWQDDEFHEKMWEEIRENGIWKGEIWDRKKNGEVYAVWETISPVINEDRKITNYIGILYDITDKKIAEEYIQKLGYYDPLTELPNRTLLIDRLKHAMQESQRTGESLAILFVDLDNFKKINDTVGHHIGDLILKTIAERVQETLREYDTVARVGGDEFVVILNDVSSARNTAVIATKIINIFKEPFTLEGQEIFLSTSIGISQYPGDGDTIKTLLQNADTAMFHAKEKGKNNFQFYRKEMNEMAYEKLVLETNLHHALENNQFRLFYQAQVETLSEKIIGVEALIRWDDPRKGIVSPGDFIHIAETTGLIIPIGEWSLRQACVQHIKWKDEGFPGIRVAVNLSLIQMKDEGLLDMIARILHDTGMDPRHLELEITESFFMDDMQASIKTIKKLTSMGIEIAIDDFGTGYSSLSYLARLPVDKLKIDKSFISESTTNPEFSSITTAIISLGKTLNLKVIAEGVETEEQLNFLLIQGCDEIQGYYFSKPLPPEGFLKLLRDS